MKSPSMPAPPAPPPPPPTPPHMAQAAQSAKGYEAMQRGGIAGTILTSAGGASDYGGSSSKGKSLLGQ